MSPAVALYVWLVLLLGLLCFDPAKEAGTSAALWIPVIWIFFAASRLPSQWLGGGMATVVAGALEDGNPVDRSIYLVLILLAMGILMSRSFNWAGFFSRNAALTVFLAFALVSVLWSDFPFVAFKRWFRDLGNYAVILVVLSDPRPLNAVRTVLRRLCYLLVPLSILLIKYYAALGRQYNQWDGTTLFNGVTTGKNLLGLVALLSGLFFFWDVVARWSDHKKRGAKRILLVDLAFLLMSLYLLDIANSATCRVCMVLGCLVIVAAHSKLFQRRPRILETMIPAGYCLYLILAFGFGMSGSMAAAVGKDPTLTDRTKIWAFVLDMHTNPLLGTGYESFWLGPRLQWFKQEAQEGAINEAHNGYLEVYLNLGLIGCALIVGLLISTFVTICKKFRPFSALASFSLAVWTVMLFFSITEASFRSGLMWLVFLMIGLEVPQRAEDPVLDAAPSHVRPQTGFSGVSLEAASRRR